MPSKADIEKPISLVRPSNAKSLQSILDRAHGQERKAGKNVARSVNKALNPSRSKGLLSKTLGMALSHHGRTKKNGPSLRPKAPDTNGRAFHFSHSTVGKGSPGPKPGSAGGTSPGSGGGGGGNGGGSDGKPGRGSPGSAGAASGGSSKGSRAMPDLGSKEAGHQRYVERDGALAQDAKEVFGHEVGGPAIEGGWEREPGQERTGPKKESDGREAAGPTLEEGQEHQPHARPIEMDVEAIKKEISRASKRQDFQSAEAAQQYMEDPTKVEPQTRHGHSNSFGTIGATFEERVAFWNDVQAHEREKDARTQIRQVLELPHEATPEARQEIVKRHCQQYEDLGVPYWASIHAPTNKNDDRNFHAHIVHGIRPAKRVVDPETGKLAWDFTITEAYKKKNRVKKTRHPYRQNAVAEFWNRDYVRESRKRFAETANAVLEEHGCDVRYDARSYKDMGLDIEPMKHVSRIVADKTSKQDFVVMDAEWTRRLIEREMQVAALGRDATYMKLKSVERRLAAATGSIGKSKGANKANARLPKAMKVSPLSKMTHAVAKKITAKMLTVEKERLEQRFADENTTRTIQHVIDATAPVSAHRKGKERRPPAPAYEIGQPDGKAMAALHAAAVEEMRNHRAATASRMERTYHRARAALDEWRAEAKPAEAANSGPPPDGTQPRYTRPAKAERATQPTPAMQPRHAEPAKQRAAAPYQQPAPNQAAQAAAMQVHARTSDAIAKARAMAAQVGRITRAMGPLADAGRAGDREKYEAMVRGFEAAAEALKASREATKLESEIREAGTRGIEAAGGGAKDGTPPMNPGKAPRIDDDIRTSEAYRRHKAREAEETAARMQRAKDAEEAARQATATAAEPAPAAKPAPVPELAAEPTRAAEPAPRMPPAARVVAPEEPPAVAMTVRVSAKEPAKGSNARKAETTDVKIKPEAVHRKTEARNQPPMATRSTNVPPAAPSAATATNEPRAAKAKEAGEPMPRKADAPSWAGASPEQTSMESAAPRKLESPVTESTPEQRERSRARREEREREEAERERGRKKRKKSRRRILVRRMITTR